MSYTYIASPYSHPNPRVRADRYRQALDFVHWALEHKIWCYSPIVHCHELAVIYKLPFDISHWREYNEAMLQGCKHLIVLKLEDWDKSKGVDHEIRFADSLGKPISYMSPASVNAYRIGE